MRNHIGEVARYGSLEKIAAGRLFFGYVLFWMVVRCEFKGASGFSGK